MLLGLQQGRRILFRRKKDREPPKMRDRCRSPVGRLNKPEVYAEEICLFRSLWGTFGINTGIVLFVGRKAREFLVF